MRRCCCRRPHTHSRGNTPEGEDGRTKEKKCETLLDVLLTETNRSIFYVVLLSHRHAGPQQGAGWVQHVASFSVVLHQEVRPPAAAVHLPFLQATHGTKMGNYVFGIKYLLTTL